MQKVHRYKEQSGGYQKAGSRGWKKGVNCFCSFLAKKIEIFSKISWTNSKLLEQKTTDDLKFGTISTGSKRFTIRIPNEFLQQPHESGRAEIITPI